MSGAGAGVTSVLSLPGDALGKVSLQGGKARCCEPNREFGI